MANPALVFSGGDIQAQGCRFWPLRLSRPSPTTDRLTLAGPFLSPRPHSSELSEVVISSLAFRIGMESSDLLSVTFGLAKKPIRVI